jgi:hypothetical protein
MSKAVAVPAFLVLQACAVAPTKLASIPVEVYQVQGICRVVVEGRSYLLPAEQERLLPAFRKLAAQGAIADFSPSNSSMTFRCFGHTIYLAQRAGLRLRRTGFLSEPQR